MPIYMYPTLMLTCYQEMVRRRSKVSSTWEMSQNQSVDSSDSDDDTDWFITLQNHLHYYKDLHIIGYCHSSAVFHHYYYLNNFMCCNIFFRRGVVTKKCLGDLILCLVPPSGYVYIYFFTNFALWHSTYRPQLGDKSKLQRSSGYIHCILNVKLALCQYLRSELW